MLRHAHPDSVNREVARLELETDEAKADEQTIISKISNGEFSNPAHALLEREAREADLSESARTFVARVLDTASLY